jgi:hypothetical protein
MQLDQGIYSFGRHSFTSRLEQLTSFVCFLKKLKFVEKYTCTKYYNSHHCHRLDIHGQSIRCHLGCCTLPTGFSQYMLFDPLFSQGCMVNAMMEHVHLLLGLLQCMSADPGNLLQQGNHQILPVRKKEIQPTVILYIQHLPQRSSDSAVTGPVGIRYDSMSAPTLIQGGQSDHTVSV